MVALTRTGRCRACAWWHCVWGGAPGVWEPCGAGRMRGRCGGTVWVGAACGGGVRVPCG